MGEQSGRYAEHPRVSEVNGVRAIGAMHNLASPIDGNESGTGAATSVFEFFRYGFSLDRNMDDLGRLRCGVRHFWRGALQIRDFTRLRIGLQPAVRS